MYRKDILYIYCLEEGPAVFYVGSTKEPLARYFGHLSLNTKNTAMRIAMMNKDGTPLVMRIIDATIESQRSLVESRWINELPGIINENSLDNCYRDYISAAKRNEIQSISLGTLTYDGNCIPRTPWVREKVYTPTLPLPELSISSGNFDDQKDISPTDSFFEFEHNGYKIKVVSKDYEAAKEIAFQKLNGKNAYRHNGSTIYF